MNQKSNNLNGKLVKKIFIEGTITTKTGLHIGGTNIGLSIGGTDATVVRNPITNKPYIPGSSLKGKMRSLLEKLEGRFKNEGDNTKPCQCAQCDICRIFGVPAEVAEEKKVVPARLLVRDAELTRKSANQLFASKNTDMPYTEVKTEVWIDRVTSAATPRQVERVPAGAVFNLGMVLNIYEGDNETQLLQKIKQAVQLVEGDYLGGKGTRGSGQVEIRLENFTYKDRTIYEAGGEAQKYGVKDEQV